ncbi:MAG: hypothetical protein KAR80_00295 [Rhodospirillaceae bacterium]|nr:hypothetical protein [Rhodospirillaceae bacterium]
MITRPKKRIRGPRKKRSNHLLFVILGWGFVVLGFAGLFLPILQGVLFLLVGLFLLSMTWPRARLIRQRLGKRFPHIKKAIDDAERWLKARLKRLFS